MSTITAVGQHFTNSSDGLRSIIDSPGIDAFARQRFSTPYTLFDSKQIWDDPDIANNAENFPLFWDNQQVSGGSTTTAFNVNRASTVLGVALNTAGKRVRQTKQRFNYQPGKSQVGIFTLVDLKTTTGITKEVGMSDDQNGLFFRSKDGEIYCCVKSYATGSAVVRAFSQADWAVDKLNGNGASGINLDFVKSHIPFVDFEWLGVGRVRYGWFIDGLPYYCHVVNNANDLDVVYMSTPNLPVRYSLENDGNGAASTLEQICCSVISEGGLQPNGAYRAPNPATTSATVIQANSANTTYAVAAIRLKPAYLSAVIEIIRVNMVLTTNDKGIWGLHFNPTLSASIEANFTNIPSSAIQYAYCPTSSPGVTVTAPGYVVATGSISTNASIESAVTTALKLGSTIAGVPDVFVLSITPFSSNCDAIGSLNWRELW